MALSPATVTILDFLALNCPRLKSSGEVPSWPPDLFALMASLLRYTGAYSAVIEEWPDPLDSKSFCEYADEVGKEWFDKLDSLSTAASVPTEVSALWTDLQTNWLSTTSEFIANARLVRTCLKLMSLADEACKAFLKEDTNVYIRVRTFLHRNDYTSICSDAIVLAGVKVLPKWHTPQSGLTIRSFSLYLALVEGNEVRPKWVESKVSIRGGVMNLLVIPWPFTVLPRQFRESTSPDGHMVNMPDEFGFFEFTPLDESNLTAIIEEKLRLARNSLGHVSGIVLPELAVTNRMFEILQRLCAREQVFLLCGVGSEAENSLEFPQNRVVFYNPQIGHVWQNKHHRWKLNRSQIRQYGIGSQLAPTRKWWENIQLKDRVVHFVRLDKALVLAPLICEDLARPDPIGETLRSIAPNLVIALLMDGPQLRERWPGRYAMNLADDPGSSVLTLTSLGMCSLSRTYGGESRKGVIGLWKDAKDGTPIEIEVTETTPTAVLSIATSEEKEFSADGRFEQRLHGSFPTLVGLHYF